MVRYLKRLKSSRLGRVQAFPMYGGLGMSAPSLHRESTDSLIVCSVHLRLIVDTSAWGHFNRYFKSAARCLNLNNFSVPRLKIFKHEDLYAKKIF